VDETELWNESHGTTDGGGDGSPSAHEGGARPSEVPIPLWMFYRLIGGETVGLIQLPPSSVDHLRRAYLNSTAQHPI
jgi:hypothetical protein